MLTTRANTISNANAREQSLLRQQNQDGEIIEPWWGTFNILDENIVGLPSDRQPRHDEVLSVIRTLEDDEISSCFVEEYATLKRSILECSCPLNRFIQAQFSNAYYTIAERRD